ncbi:MAG: T9SS type A sorting domain-containing protein [Flavobacteriales bacterium]|jgi:hypothetical protein|nr:T9SS type A sorting domain-containing protein [Flavobacteriales bacterium]
MRAHQQIPGLLAALIAMSATAQTPYPELTVQDVAWTEGTHHYAVSNRILSPGAPNLPATISGTADAEFVSATSVRLAPGFHAGGLSGGGRFRARIDQGLGQVADLIIIPQEPYSYIADNIVHVHKWEKLELGLKLPQDYQNAIDSFFTHYYSDSTDIDRASPYNVDVQHDLNPYADDSLQLVMTLTDPNGTSHTKWGFFMKEAKWASSNMMALLMEDFADPLHPFHVRFRFAPNIVGAWQVALSLRAPFTTSSSNDLLPFVQYSGFNLICDPPLEDNKGTLRVNEANKRTLQFEAGESFMALGTNLNPASIGTGLWWDVNNYRMQRGALDSMLQAMSQLHASGGNFIRVFLGDKSFAPENVNLGVYDRYRDGLTCDLDSPVVRGNAQFQCWAFDQVVDRARQQGLYIQLCTIPYPPLGAYESNGWHNDAYLNSFVKPRDPITNLYDLKKFFYLDGDTLNLDTGSFRYWKRRFKYIMSRWGYSVNVPIIELFNEIDQMLTYSDGDFTGGGICPENNIVWPADPELRPTIDKWATDIIRYVRSAANSTDPANSALGDSCKLFTASYAGGFPFMPDAEEYYTLYSNPEIDLIDAHKGLGAWWDIHAYSSGVDDYRGLFPNGLSRKPFTHGEFTHYVSMPGYGGNIEKIFHNYWVSFHNELWAAALSGKYAAGTSWIYGTVYWWRHSVEQPPSDSNNGEQNGPFSKTLGAVNNLDLGLGIPLPIKNRSVHHHFRPLADLLAHPSWTAYDFFNGDYTAHDYYDETDANLIDSYYLKSLDSTIAIGWVHNRNSWVKNYYYNKNTDTTQNFLGCTAPEDTAILLSGFLPNTEYHITWFPTWLGSSIVPIDTVRTAENDGTLLLDLSTAPLGDTVQYFLDTLHADYAYIITLDPFVKARRLPQEDDPPAVEHALDFTMFPNPAHDELVLGLPDDLTMDILLLDVMGRRLRAWAGITATSLRISLDPLARGAYAIRVTDGAHSRTKKLIIH